MLLGHEITGVAFVEYVMANDLAERKQKIHLSKHYDIWASPLRQRGFQRQQSYQNQQVDTDKNIVRHDV